MVIQKKFSYTTLLWVLIATTAISLIFLFNHHHRPRTKADFISRGAFDKTPSKKIVAAYDEHLTKAIQSNPQLTGPVTFLKKNIAYNKEVHDLYYQAAQFFGDTPGGFAAARYIATNPIWTSNAEFGELMAWTQRDLNANSAAIFAVIQSQESQTFGNAFVQQSFMNLVYHLDLSNQDKLQYFFDVMKVPVALNSDGQLTGDSLAFNTALILAKNTEKSAAVVAQQMPQILANNPDPAVQAQLKKIVVSYYPELQGVL